VYQRRVCERGWARSLGGLATGRPDVNADNARDGAVLALISGYDQSDRTLGVGKRVVIYLPGEEDAGAAQS